MKLINKFLLGGLAIAALVLPQSCTTTSGPAKLATKADSLSYSYGVMMARDLANEDGLNAEMVAAGIREAMNEAGQVTTEEASNAIAMGKAQVGIDFLAENAKKEGIIITASGLQHKVDVEGTGNSPVATDVVTVHYTGTLIDGTVFDSSVQRGEPIAFPLNRVIPGWTEGLQLMKEGGKSTFYIPYDLAYGANGAGQVIPPYAALIFEVELIKIGELEKE